MTPGPTTPAPGDGDDGSRGGSDENGCWIDLTGEALDDLGEVAERFGLHELAVEDAHHAHQRPKLERYGDTLVVVAKPAVYDDAGESIGIGELLVALGPSFVVSVRHGVARDLPVRGESRDPERRHVEHALDDDHPVDVLYRLLDAVVDGYQPIIDGLRQDITEIEHEVFSVGRSNPTARIYALKRHVLEMLRNVEPLVDPLAALAEGTAIPTRHPELDEYFRDVYDHARRLVLQLETINDVLSDVLQANLAQVSVAQNDDMRRMSAWAAIFLVPTLMAGIWGMNFDGMPELDWRFGYPVALGSMLLASTTLWWQFRRIGWLVARARGRSPG